MLIYVCVCVCPAKSLHSCLTPCDPLDCGPPGSSVPGISQARILEWVAMPSCRGSSQFRDQTRVSYFSCIGRQVLYHWRLLRSPICVYYEEVKCSEVAQLCPTLCDPMDCSLPGSIHGIFQARILE